jgi:dipeptidyl-peptidase-3
MRKFGYLIITGCAATLLACSGGSEKAPEQTMEYMVDKFADAEVLRYEVTGFDGLDVRQKKLLYYLSQAAVEGRDILFDQNGRYNMQIRRTLEAVFEHYAGDRTAQEWKEFEIYLKRVWFSNGIHHHYGQDKFLPGFSEEFFAAAVNGISPEYLPLKGTQTAEELVRELVPVMFDPAVMSKKVNQAQGEDLILTSANNYYYGVTQAEAEGFYAAMKNPAD